MMDDARMVQGLGCKIIDRPKIGHILKEKKKGQMLRRNNEDKKGAYIRIPDLMQVLKADQ